MFKLISIYQAAIQKKQIDYDFFSTAAIEYKKPHKRVFSITVIHFILATLLPTIPKAIISISSQPRRTAKSFKVMASFKSISVR